jgi:hypothetical protein
MSSERSMEGTAAETNDLAAALLDLEKEREALLKEYVHEVRILLPGWHDRLDAIVSRDDLVAFLF